MIDPLATATEHYAWMAFEAAYMGYGITDDRTWEALNAWLDASRYIALNLRQES